MAKINTYFNNNNIANDIKCDNMKGVADSYRDTYKSAELLSFMELCSDFQLIV